MRCFRWFLSGVIGAAVCVGGCGSKYSVRVENASDKVMALEVRAKEGDPGSRVVAGVTGGRGSVLDYSGKLEGRPGVFVRETADGVPTGTGTGTWLGMVPGSTVRARIEGGRPGQIIMRKFPSEPR